MWYEKQKENRGEELSGCNPVFLKVGGIAPLGDDFVGQVGEKKKVGDRGAKKHQGGENAQPLIDDRVNFNILQL